jgi:hypothetical protein
VQPDADKVAELKTGGGVLWWRRRVVTDGDRGGLLQCKENENKVMHQSIGEGAWRGRRSPSSGDGGEVLAQPDGFKGALVVVVSKMSAAENEEASGSFGVELFTWTRGKARERGST